MRKGRREVGGKERVGLDFRVGEREENGVVDKLLT